MEIWKPVPGHEGGYEISSQGNVRSLPRFARSGAGRRTVPGGMLNPGLASNGYYTVAIGRGNSRTVHSLVAEAFLGPCPVGCEVLHIDGSRTNNVLGNLRYGTRSENIYDAVRHGSWMSEARIEHCKKLRGYRGGTTL